MLLIESYSSLNKSVENAQAYFDPSTLIKLTKKPPGTLLAKLPRMKKRFAHFLHQQANSQYLLAGEGGMAKG